MGAQPQSDLTRRSAAGRGLSAALALLLVAASPLALAQGASPAGRASPSRPAAAQPGPAEEQDDDTPGNELVVRGARDPVGSVVGDIKPEITLAPQEIQSYAVSNVEDLLTELAPQTSTGPGSGPPVILLNGRRISGFNEVREIPTEAILRVEILPQEAALKYGYSADQRVVNIVLRPFFRAKTGEATGGGPTAGGQVQGQVQLDYMRIRRDTRLNVSLKAQDSTAITENERDVVQPTSVIPFDPRGNVVSAASGAEIDPALSALAGRPVLIAGAPATVAAGGPALQDFVPTAGVPNVTDIGRYRTLVGSSSQASANVVYTRPTVAGIQATVNATFEATHGESLQGLPGVALKVAPGSPFSPFANPVVAAWDVSRFGPLRQVSDGWTGHLGTTLNRDAGRWRFTLTSAYDHAYSRTRTDTGVDGLALQQRLDALDPAFDPFVAVDPALNGLLPQNLATSNTDTANVHLLASGPILSLPAGKMNLTLHAGDEQSWYGARSTLFGHLQAVDLSRNDANGRVNLDAPVSRRGGTLGFLGDLTLNGNVAYDRLSDFGTLTAYGYGANWRPIPAVTLLVSHTRDEAAPSFKQFGGPVVVTPGARVFDFVSGQTVDVNMVTGGNPALISSRRDVTRIGLMLRPLAKQDFTITANYTHTFTRNPIETFPAATAQIQAVFPSRFVRDDNDDLTDVDYRPVNFASEDRSQLRWGINFTRPFGKAPPPPTREQLEQLRRQFAERARQFAPRRPAQNGQGQNAQGQNPQGQGARGPGGQGQVGQLPGGGAPGPDGPAPTFAFGGPGDGGGPPGGGGFGGPPGGGGFRGPGGPGGFGFGGGQGRGGGQPGRMQFAIYHTVTFRDRLLVRSGGPTFDLLNGYPSGAGGGTSRHRVEAQAGFTWRGMGARASANWQSGTFIGGAGSPTGALTFSPIGTVDLRLFADFAQNRALVLRHRWLAGTRVTLSATNLLDAREHVRDATGATPISYQPAYIDPIGRVVKLTVRKLIF